MYKKANLINDIYKIIHSKFGLTNMIDFAYLMRFLWTAGMPINWSGLPVCTHLMSVTWRLHLPTSRMLGAWTTWPTKRLTCKAHPQTPIGNEFRNTLKSSSSVASHWISNCCLIPVLRCCGHVFVYLCSPHD